ncbi:Fic family protein [Pseudoxanthomonas suwonensis]|uniref:Cell division protein Fic n=1 Tax=Pseudoxanthomonas suwonensis TaxID=314722 RepID=A0A0E3UMA1_9GAMM|nr:Fic family protein [Pseudoxanthomonas suwonensis]AKC85860.1 cell division protein Fic [Pseudoxanthomonas suwonensis]
MTAPHWIWQHQDWPRFTWQADALAPLLRACQQAQGQLLGMAGLVASDQQAEEALDTLLSNIITSSAIEGERLDAASVRSSLARHLGLAEETPRRPTPRSEGLAELMLDATGHADAPFDLPRLLQWHRWLFPDRDRLVPERIRVGMLRGEEPMQVVSGRIDRPTVHFEAPPRAGLEARLDEFLAWFSRSREDAALDPLLRAGIAHFWFVTLHPFDDGNGRLTRALTDLALAQAQPQAIRFHAMSASILADRAGYYRILESSQKGGLDVTAWLQWFLQTLHDSLVQALHRIDGVLARTRFWQQHRDQALSAEQAKVLNRLLDGDFEHGISARQYQAVAKVSKATATRHLADLLEKGCLRRLPGGGRSTRYVINAPAIAAVLPIHEA